MSAHSRLLEVLKSVDSALGRAWTQALRGPRREVPSEPRDALVVRLWGLGNLALVAPHLRASSHLRLRLLTLERNLPFVAEHLPGVTALGLPDPSSPRLPFRLASVLGELGRDPPEVVVDLEGFLRLPVAAVRAVSRAPVVGLDTPGQDRSALLDLALPHDPSRHVADTFEALWRLAGLPTGDARHGLVVRPSLRHAVASLLAPLGSGLVVLHPGSGDHVAGRRWPAERFAALARTHLERGRSVVVTGTRQEARLVARICRDAPGARALAGQLDVAHLVALLDLADLVVTNDTGPLHLAAALGTPTVGLYGPNTPIRTGPRGPRTVAVFADLPCSPCLDDRTMKRSPCPHFRCMTALTVEAVVRAGETLLAAPRPAPVDRPRDLARDDETHAATR